MWQDKGKGLWASKGSKLWEGKYMGKLIVDKGSFSKVCYVDSSGMLSGADKGLELSLVINFCPSW